MATITDVSFTRDAVVLDVDASHWPNDRVWLDHDDAVELAAGVLVHAALGAIAADEVVDPGHEVARMLNAAAARATAMLCECLHNLRELRAEDRCGVEERCLVVHEGGGETTAARGPALSVVAD